MLLDIDCNYRIYSLSNKTFLEKCLQSQCSDLRFALAGWNQDFKLISSDNSFLAALSDSGISIVNYHDGHLITRFEETIERDFITFSNYAMAFSSDSKYFAVITNCYIDTLWSSFQNKKYSYNVKKGNKLILYETKTWNKIWEKDLSKEE